MRLQIPSRDVKVLHVHSILHAVVAVEATELSSLPWNKLRRGLPTLHSTQPRCLWRVEQECPCFSRLAIAQL